MAMAFGIYILSSLILWIIFIFTVSYLYSVRLVGVIILTKNKIIKFCDEF